MRFASILYLAVVIGSLFTHASPITKGKAISKTTTVPKAKAAILPTKLTAARPVKAKTATKAKTTAPKAKAATNPSTSTPKTKASVTKTKATTPNSKAAVPLSCPLYTAADRIDISSRDLVEFERRANEEFWFRFDDPAITKGAQVLALAPRNSAKDFDDQAYKWISTDVSKVQRASIKGRLATLYVLPGGTRQGLLAQAKDFDESKAAKKREDFVTKDNEPGDVGIQGVTPGPDGKLPLDVLRDQVIRVVVKQTSAKAGGKPTFTTITKGKISNGATKADQAALNNFC